MIYICNFHVLSDLLLIYICKLHWNLQELLAAPGGDSARAVPAAVSGPTHSSNENTPTEVMRMSHADLLRENPGEDILPGQQRAVDLQWTCGQDLYEPRGAHDAAAGESAHHF